MTCEGSKPAVPILVGMPLLFTWALLCFKNRKETLETLQWNMELASSPLYLVNN